LVAIATKFLYLMIGQQFRQSDKLKTSFCFHQFFQSDVGLVSEVCVAFSGTGFLIIWGRRRATADDLAGNMSSQSRVRKSVDYSSYSCRKLPKPIRQLVGVISKVL